MRMKTLLTQRSELNSVTMLKTQTQGVKVSRRREKVELGDGNGFPVI